jgi:hypothetical protein
MASSAIRAIWVCSSTRWAGRSLFGGRRASLSASYTAPRCAHTCGREAAALAVRRGVRGLSQPHVAPNSWSLFGALPPTMRLVANRTLPLPGRHGKSPAFGALARRCASNASLAESSTDILLWEIPLKSHFAAAGTALSQPMQFSSSESCATRHAAARSPAPFRFTAVFALPCSVLITGHPQTGARA